VERDRVYLEDMKEALKQLNCLKKLPKGLMMIRESNEIARNAIESAGTKSSKKKIHRSKSVKIPKNYTKLKLLKEKHLESREKRRKADVFDYKRAKICYVNLKAYAENQHFGNKSKDILSLKSLKLQLKSLK